MRYAISILLALTLIGCGKQQRAQSGADAVSGIKAARVALEAGMATQEAINILTGVEKYIPAATGVSPAEWPAPRMTPEQIVADPQKYSNDAPPPPSGWGAQLWSAAVLAGGLAAWLLKRGLPLIPGIGGPARALIEMGADVLWKVAATKDQKALDDALAQVSQAAKTAAPAIDALLLLPRDLLPERLRGLLESEEIKLALDRLSSQSQT